MPEITLIPKREKPQFRFSIQRVVFSFPVTLLILTLLVFGGFFLYNFMLNRSIKAVDAQVEEIESKRDLKKDDEFINKIFNLSNRINNLKRILDIQSHPSFIFSFFEKLTLPKTRYFDFNSDFSAGTITATGEVDGYIALVKQMIVFSENPDVKDVKFSNIGLSPGGRVSFGLELKFDKKILGEER